MNPELPQSAIDAGLSAASGKQHFYQRLGVEPEFTMLVGAVLAAAAPHIAAKVLWDAADHICRHGQGRSADWADGELSRLAREAEGTDRLHATNDTDRLHEPAGGEIHIHEGTGTYDPDVPESAFKNPKIDLQPFVTELAQRIGIHNNHLRMGLPDKPSNPWRKWESNDDLEAGVRYETYKDNTGQRWIRDA